MENTRLVEMLDESIQREHELQAAVDALKEKVRELEPYKRFTEMVKESARLDTAKDLHNIFLGSIWKLSDKTGYEFARDLLGLEEKTDEETVEKTDEKPN